MDWSESTVDPDFADAPGRRDWESKYPTWRDVLFADINQCPPHLRHHFGLELLDENFVIPTTPYLYIQHQEYVTQLRLTDSKVFDEKMEMFVTGAGHIYWTKASVSSQPSSSNAPSHVYHCTRPHNVDPNILKTSRPELCGNSTPGVKYVFHPCSSSTMKHQDKEKVTEEKITSEEVSPIFNHVLGKCEKYIETEKKITKKLVEEGLVTSVNKTFVQIEDNLLEMASVPDCTDGTFYCAIFNVLDHLYIRYFESGTFKNISRSVFEIVKRAVGTDSFEQCLLWQPYNGTDVCEHMQSHALNVKEKSNTCSRKDKRTSRNDKLYDRLLKTNESSIQSSLHKYFSSCESLEEGCGVRCLGTCVVTVYSGHQQILDKKQNDRRYFNCSGTLQNFQHELEQLFLTYPSEMSPDAAIEQLDFSSYVISTSLPENPSMLQQSEIINRISNLNTTGKSNKFEQRFSFSPKKPHSLRNVLLWSFSNMKHRSHYDRALYELAGHSDSAVPGDVESTESTNIDQSSQRPSKKRKITKEHLKKIISNAEPIFSSSNMQGENMSLYVNYKSQLLLHGSIYWQLQSQYRDVFILNDYSADTGEFKKSEYVHCSRFSTENGFRYSCECKIFHTLQCQSLDMDPYVDNDTIKCVHCRLLFEEIPSGNETYTSALQEKIANSRLYVGKRVIELKQGSPNVHQYSVLSGEECSFVNLVKNVTTGKFMVNCKLSRCQITRGSKRTIDYLNRGKMCLHLKIFQQNPQLWTNYCNIKQVNDPTTSTTPEPNVNDDSEDEITVTTDLAPSLSVEDETEEESKALFQEETGLWSFESVSQHAPRRDGDNELVAALQIRDLLVDQNSSCSPRVEGCLQGPCFKPTLPEQMCGCGAGWTDDQFPDGRYAFQRTITLYTMQAPVICKIYSCLCVSGNCRVMWDEGKTQCIHVSTPDTCAGDEIGWTFVDRVMQSKQSFTSFCSEMTHQYKRRCPDSKNFMSPHVFIKWWFGWAANQKIDFRKPCPVCKHDPKQLACDGTKIGVNFKYMDIQPIETRNEACVLQSPHGRHARCFFSYNAGKDFRSVRLARENVLSLAKHALKEHVDSVESMEEKAAQAMEHFPDMCRSSFQRFCSGHMEFSEQTAYAKFLKFLATTAPVCSLIPYRFIPSIRNLYQPVWEGVAGSVSPALFNETLYEMRFYAPELRELIAASVQCTSNLTGCPHPDILDLLLFIIQNVESMSLVEPESAVPQDNTYNPPKFGRAYYFSDTGKKLRNIRTFTQDLVSKQAVIYDDEPMGFEKCSKIYPQVSKKGTSFLFAWFCVLHGHCYGFHMIPGSEGRKDPYASLYSHLDNPPDEIFYDFACNLHEYCLNRESGYYHKVRFFHDIFHSYAHSCSDTYKSTRLNGFEAVNSEICEQFNSFIQCIKYSARQMSQVHFVFYLQFFIHLWNERKATQFQKRLSVALAGTV